MIGSNAFSALFRDSEDRVTSTQCTSNVEDFQAKKYGEVIDGKRLSKVHQASYDSIKLVALLSLTYDLGVEGIHANVYLENCFQPFPGNAILITNVSESCRRINE